jgi:hypothetical protein
MTVPEPCGTKSSGPRSPTIVGPLYTTISARHYVLAIPLFWRQFVQWLKVCF